MVIVYELMYILILLIKFSMTLGSTSPFVSCGSSNETFTCLVDEKCIPMNKHCDGTDDCPDNSDEMFCSSSCIGEGWFRCDNGHCVSVHWICDEEDDCMDWSDEKSCDKDEKSVPDVSSVTCQGTDYKCGDGLCIPVSWTCDGQEDCRHGDDENTELCGSSQNLTCSQHFTCGSGTCIPHSWVCDGEVDCHEDELDEKYCGLEHNGTDACKTTEGLFPCADGSKCLLPIHVCDNITQCTDGSDEGDFCKADRNCSTVSCSHECINSQSGPQCYCQAGFELAKDNTSCVDVDECKIYGKCSHKCLNTAGSYECSCFEGYVMRNKSCVAELGDPFLFFSTKSEIRGMKVNSMQYFPVAHQLNHAVGVGFDGSKGRVYWTDVEAGREALLSVNFDGSEGSLLITSGLVMPEDLVVDEVNRNVYFTDSNRKHLAVCSLDGKGCAVLLSNIEQPRAVALCHNMQKVIYSDWGSKPAVVSVNFDGSSPFNIVSQDVVWPNGVAVDEVMERIYWSDAKKDTIESIKMDGSDRRIVLNTIAKHPFSLAVFEDILYWSDWELQEILSCNKFSGKNVKSLVKESGVQPMGITIAHPLISNYSRTSPCVNSPCSHVCLPKPLPSSDFVCACPSDMVLDSSGTKCTTSSSISRMILSTSSALYDLHPLVLGNSSTTLISALSDQDSFLYDIESGSDSSIYLIKRGSSNGVFSFDLASHSFKDVLEGDQFGSVSYDPFTNSMFWVDVHDMKVIMHSLTTGKQQVIFTSTSSSLIIYYVPQKKSLVIGEEGRITVVEMENVMEPSKHLILASTRITAPTSFAYCELTDSLFVGDSGSKSLSRWKWGQTRLTPFMERIGEVESISVTEEKLFWVEKSTQALFYVSIHNPQDFSWLSLANIVNISDKLSLIVSEDLNVDKSFNTACLQAQCSHFCLNEEKEGSYKCVCPLEMVMGDDSHSCKFNCVGNVFNCGDGKCLPTLSVCDGSKDCTNGADERDCSRNASIPMKDEVLMESTENSSGKSNGAILGVVITVLVVALLLVLFCFVKSYFSDKKQQADTHEQIMFTNQTFGVISPVSDLERGNGGGIIRLASRDTNQGYENFGFSPKTAADDCANNNKDDDSAFEKCSKAASSVDNRHFSVGEEEDMDPEMMHNDRLKLI